MLPQPRLGKVERRALRKALRDDVPEDVRWALNAHDVAAALLWHLVAGDWPAAFARFKPLDELRASDLVRWLRAFQATLEQTVLDLLEQGGEAFPPQERVHRQVAEALGGWLVGEGEWVGPALTRPHAERTYVQLRDNYVALVRARGRDPDRFPVELALLRTAALQWTRVHYSEDDGDGWWGD